MAGKNDSIDPGAPGSAMADGRQEKDSSWQARSPQPGADTDSGATSASALGADGSNANIGDSIDMERKWDLEEERPAMNAERPRQDCKAPRGMFDRSLQAQLGRQLRSIYSTVAGEPVPDRFVRLLEELAAREKRR